MTRATPADIARIWAQLWGNLTPEQVKELNDSAHGEAYDRTQLTDTEIAALEMTS